MIAISERGALWLQAALLLAILNIKNIRKVTACFARDLMTGLLTEACKFWAVNRVTDTPALHAAIAVRAIITIIARHPLKLWSGNTATTCSSACNSLEALTMHSTGYVGA